MSYRWVDHTAEVELEIEAAGEREVLEEALRALAELLGVDGVRRRSTIRHGHRAGPSRAARRLDRGARLPGRVGGLRRHALLDLDLAPDAPSSATVAGVLDEPPPLVKAVTYHRLAFDPIGRRVRSRA